MFDLTVAQVEANFHELFEALELAAEFVDNADVNTPRTQRVVLTALRDSLARGYGMRTAIVAELNRREALMKASAPAGPK
jgi:hypothetical protein